MRKTDKQTVIKPLCSASPRDAKDLLPYAEIFTQPAARRLGICAVVEYYSFVQSMLNKRMKFALLKRMDDGSIVNICDEALPGSPEAQDIQTLSDHVYRIRAPRNVAQDMIDVSYTAPMLFIFPTLAIGQSEDISGELASISQHKTDLSRSLWVRSACGRIRGARGTSNHELLKTMSEISFAWDVVTRFRASDIDQLAKEGYEIAPVSVESIKSDLMIAA
jgi:hypothetical protein